MPEVVTVNAMRGAPYVMPRADARIFTAALVPDDDEALVALVGRSELGRIEGFGVREALERVAAAAREGLKDGPLEKDAFHQAMRERLPDGLLPWCRGCESHHVRPGFWRALGPLEVTQMPARSTWALADPPSMDLAEARAELVRRFLRCFGPGHAHAARVVGTARDVLRQGALRRGRGRARGRPPRRSQGVRPRGRRSAASSPRPRRAASASSAATTRTSASPTARRSSPTRRCARSCSRAVGRPGVVLADGELAGLWRCRKRGDVLEVEPDWIGDPVDIAAEAAAVAQLRGCARARPGADPRRPGGCGLLDRLAAARRLRRS